MSAMPLRFLGAALVLLSVSSSASRVASLAVEEEQSSVRLQRQSPPLRFSILEVEEGEMPSVHLDEPSQEPQSFSVQKPDMSYSQWSQDKILAPILEQIKEGFFVESGARDGEIDSNTIFFEARGWRGLLVEPGPEYEAIAAKCRKVHTFHGALSPTRSSERLHFQATSDGLGHSESRAGFIVQAEPLERLLAAVNPSLKTVDFWSLDIEGAEAMVLEATDFEQIEVGVLLVEMNKSPENNARISAVMEKSGFVDIGRTSYDGGYLDHVFANPTYFSRRGLPMPSHVPGLD